MEIDVLIDEGIKGCPEPRWLRMVAEQVLVAQDVDSTVEMSLVIATGERVRELNRIYLGRDRPTDVIAFYMLGGEEDRTSFVPPPDGVQHLGEVIISYPQAQVQAEEHGHSMERELTILIIHGVLHLLGYGDEKPELKRVMSAREKEMLSHIEEGKD